MSDIADGEARRVARNAYQLQYYHAHKDAINARRKELGTSRAYAREYYHENKEALKAKAQSEAGRESARLRQKRFREKDPDQTREYYREYYAANIEKRREASRKWWRAERQRDPTGFWALRVYHAARTRAKKTGLPFDLDRDHIFSLCVTHCPALGLELTYNATGTPPNCASLDRIRPELGYVRGNVVVVSYLANTIKQNATAAEVAAVARWMETLNGPD